LACGVTREAHRKECLCHDRRGAVEARRQECVCHSEAGVSERRLLTGLATVLYSASSVAFAAKADGFFGKRAMNGTFSRFASRFTYRFSFTGERVGETRAEMTQ
jgi:hypothetical protein